MIIGISGVAGAGKDTVADFLVRDHGFVKVALADPLKRIAQEVFRFTDEQLWGGSNKRDEQDKRYLRPRGRGIVTRYSEGSEPYEALYLTPRYALQQLGTEWGRNCYENVWVDYALRVAKELLSNHLREYHARQGLHWAGGTPQTKIGIVIPDVRFKNEIEAIKTAGGKVVRIKREGSGLKGQAAEHASEAEQLTIPDEAFDYVLDNSNGPLSALEEKVAEMVKCLT